MKDPETKFSMNRRDVLKQASAFGFAASMKAYSQSDRPLADADDRRFWMECLSRIGEPVLTALSKRELKATMPVEAPHGNGAERAQFTYLEAFGRLLSGIAPWIETGGRSGAEGQLRARYAEMTRECVDAATDPASPDFMNFNHGSQPVVDAAFLTLGILRAPTELWDKLDKRVQQNVIRALQSSRVIKPGYSNWLLFSALIEAGLSRMGAWWDPMRIDLAVRAIDSFYKGDGLYGDGPELHFDYYNSYVIHPMLVSILDQMAQVTSDWKQFTPNVMLRAQRYAQIQERLISPEGTFPPVGRSLAYRFGAFHALADASLRQMLPENVSPGQVRCALTAVMRRMIGAAGTFDERGWLRIGFCGHQPHIAEAYISTGSSYLCSTILLPLGLAATHPFWAAPPQLWTSKKAWSGADLENDHAIRA